MRQVWKAYSDKFLVITPREQIFITLTGLVVIIFGFFNFSLDPNLAEGKSLDQQNARLVKSDKRLESTIADLEVLLKRDPNKVLQRQIDNYQKQLLEVDETLSLLTSELINPIQMRKALLALLHLQKGVTLKSFEIVGARPLIATPKLNEDENQTSDTVLGSNEENSDQSLNLFRHGIKIKLSGRYFQLRDYLKQLEDMPWQFFWHSFDYNVVEYPNSELEIEIYSLSTNQEFIGV